MIKSAYLVALLALSFVVIIPPTNSLAHWERFTDLDVAGQVYTMLEIGDDLYIGGSFDTTVNGEHLAHIARHGADGKWHALADGVNHAVWALAKGRDGSLLVGGEFDSASGILAGDIASWNGQTWSSMNGGFREHYQGVHTILVTSNSIYVGGQFSTTIDGDSVNNIAQWDGTKWIALGKGIGVWRGALPVWKIAPFKEGVAVAGYFSKVGDTPGSGIAIWQNGEWSALYSGPDEVHTTDIVAFNGSIAYAGEFGTVHPDQPAFVSYDGHSSYPIPSPGFKVGNLTVLHGSVAVGNSPIGSAESMFNNIAIFSAGSWEQLDGGTNGTIEYLSTNESGSDLLVSGYFTQAGGQPTSGFAVWRPDAAVQKSSQSVALSLYPNPAFGELHVVGQVSRVRNSLGIAESVPIMKTAEGFDLDVSKLVPGVYYVEGEHGAARFVKVSR